MRKNLIVAALAFFLGLLLTESGILSMMVSLAYSSAKGAPVPFLAGVVLIFVGSLCVVLSLRLLRRKDDRKRRPFFEM
jgi:uncharacterized membrane protein HdeD (DUF308 family)